MKQNVWAGFTIEKLLLNLNDIESNNNGFTIESYYSIITYLMTAPNLLKMGLKVLCHHL